MQSSNSPSPRSITPAQLAQILSATQAAPNYLGNVAVPGAARDHYQFMVSQLSHVAFVMAAPDDIQERKELLILGRVTWIDSQPCGSFNDEEGSSWP